MAAYLRIKIKLGNAECRTPEQVAEILRRLADKMDSERTFNRRLLDVNGNVVGQSQLYS